jgi:predicted AAA+ superfamily ATPase
MKFVRNISHCIQRRISRPEIIIIYGARQVGKTTLVQDLIYWVDQDQISFINWDNEWEHSLIDFSNGVSIIPITKNKKYIIIDEAGLMEKKVWLFWSRMNQI